MFDGLVAMLVMVVTVRLGKYQYFPVITDKQFNFYTGSTKIKIILVYKMIYFCPGELVILG